MSYNVKCLLLSAGLVALLATAAVASSPSQVDSKTGKTPLIELTKAILARASTTSEVLTLNLTNLVILLVIKAIIFGFGLFATGAIGRTSRQEGLFAESDMMLMLSYTLGASSQDYSCLNRVACEDPKKAQDYLTASKMLIKTTKILKNFLPYNSQYEDVVYGLQEAVDFRHNGGECSEQYYCKAISS